MTLLDHLNAPQKIAAEHRDGPLLILAGAGSGKTRVITYRIAKLIMDYGVYPEQILALTFTNKAAGEMRERVDAILTGAGRQAEAAGVTIATFHSFCARLLRRHADLLGLSRSFTIYDAADQLKLVKAVMEKVGMAKDRGEAKRLRGAIGAFKNQGWTPELAHENAFNSYDEEDATFYESYQQALVDANCADFGDLILGVLRIFRASSRVADSYSRRWRYQMVDEFQDTNPAQYELLKFLTRCHDNLCVVGDDDQAIYRWRGATVANILGFEKDFPDAEVVKLEQNYRSTDVILQVANDVIKHNPTRRDKTLWTAREGGDPVTCFTARDDREEASYVARQVHDLTRLGADWGDFAVFYRTNAQSRQIEEQLQNGGVPYQVIGGMSFYERSEIKDLLGYLKVALNPENAVDFQRIINTPSRRIGKVSLGKLERVAEIPGVGTLYRALRVAAGMLESAALGDSPIVVEPRDPSDEEALAALKKLGGGSKGGMVDVCEVVVALRDQIGADAVDENSLSQVANFLVDRINYMDYLDHDDPERAEDRRNNVVELLHALEEFEEDFDPDQLLSADLFGADDDEVALDDAAESAPTAVSQILRAFLERSALVHATDRMEEGGATTLMTVHGAKGLEFDTVFLVGMEDELFPSLRDMSDIEELHEERRLAYVAITRARHKLYITNAQSRRIYGKIRQTEPSRFLLDIDPERIEVDPKSSSKSIGYGYRAASGRRRRVRDRGYDEFQQATESSYFGDGVDSDNWEFDQSEPMIKGQVSKAVQQALDETPPEGDFDASFSQLSPWEDDLSADWQQEMDADASAPGSGDPEGLVAKTVSHSRFGIGKISAVSGTGPKAVLTIQFPGNGERTIIRKFVKILG